MKNLIIAASLFAALSLALPVRPVAAAGVKLKFVVAVYADGKGNPINRPEAVSCDDHSVLLSDSGNGRLLTFALVNGTMTGGKEIKSSQISYPLRARKGPNGDIFVLDGKSHKIVHLDANGNYVSTVQPTGVGGEVIPDSFDIDSAGNLYLVDVFNSQVVVLDPQGRMIRQIPFAQDTKDNGFISDITVSKNGDILIVDGVRKMVYKAGKDAKEFTPFTKSLAGYMSFPAGIQTDSKGTVYLIDRNGASIVTLGADGSISATQLKMGWKEGQLYYPSGICFNNNGEIFIADRENNRMQAFVAEQ